MSRPTVGTRTSTDTSVSVIIGTAKGTESSTFPITLQEGGDPGHEVDHVLTPIKGIDGVANATLDWASGVNLTVTHDPAVITAEKIEGLLAESGYISATPQ
jgi:copper chaperone CopZ